MLGPMNGVNPFCSVFLLALQNTFPTNEADYVVLVWLSYKNRRREHEGNAGEG